MHPSLIKANSIRQTIEKLMTSRFMEQEKYIISRRKVLYFITKEKIQFLSDPSNCVHNRWKVFFSCIQLTVHDTITNNTNQMNSFLISHQSVVRISPCCSIELMFLERKITRYPEEIFFYFWKYQNLL